MKHGRAIALWVGLLLLATSSRTSTPIPAAAHAPHAELVRAAFPLDAIAEAGAYHATFETPLRRLHGPVRTAAAAGRRDAAARCRTHTRLAALRRHRFARRSADARRNVPTTYGNPPPALHS